MNSKTIFQLNVREQEGFNDLQDLKAILDNENLTFWLMSGTLLGCMARGTFLPGDRDIDIGMWGVERDKFSKVKSSIEEVGFIIKERFDPVSKELKGIVTIQRSEMPIDIKFYQKVDGFAIRSIHKSNGYVSAIIWECIDILYFQKLQKRSLLRRFSLTHLFGSGLEMLVTKLSENQRLKTLNYLCGIWKSQKNTQYGRVVFPEKYFLNLKEKEFLGKKFNIPGKIKKYLVDEYGDDWKEDNPERKGGWDKKSHIVHKSDSNEYDLSSEDMIARHKVIKYI